MSNDILSDASDIGLKEVALNNHKMPWEKKNRISSIEIPANRVEYQIDLRKYGVDKGIDLLMVNQGDFLKQDDIWRPEVMKASMNDVEREHLRGPEIVEMKQEDIIEKAVEWRERLSLGENTDVQLLKDKAFPKSDARYWRVLDGIAACSLYDEKGDVKEYNDGEAQMLIFTWLTFKGLDKEVSDKAYENLTMRAKFLKVVNGDDRKEVDEVRKRKPNWGEVPYDKIRMVHVNNYGPAVNGSKSAIMSQVDASSYPRNTVHTYLNGMVEEHGIEVPGLTEKNSWDGKAYAIIMNFDDLISVNGLPESTLAADTFWGTRPGVGLSLPEGSVVIVSKGSSTKSYEEAGLNCVLYDPKESSLRGVIAQYFKEKEIPLLENITDTEGQGDVYEKFDIPVRNTVHQSTESGENEFEMKKMLMSLKAGREMSAEELPSLGRDKNGYNNLLDFNDAGALAIRAHQQIRNKNKLRLNSNAIANRNVWEVLSASAKKGESIEFWETLVKSEIL